MRRLSGRSATEISYAQSAQTRGGRAVIRLMENTTGRRGLLKRARGFERDIDAGVSFFDVMAARYGLSLDVIAGDLAAIPRTGPLIVIANHPYGILDGLMLGQILARSRGDFHIMAHAAFNRTPDLQRHLLPISFEGTRDALAFNIATRRRALALLQAGGAVGVFPGGTVSTGARPFARPMDPVWRNFTARMIGRTGASVVPVYFDGHTSRLFQIASHLHATLRMGLLIREFSNRTDTPVRVAIGAPLGPGVLAPFAGDGKAMMDFLRKATYGLSPEPLGSVDPGLEFEERHRAQR